MEENTNILGCFMKIGFDPNLKENEFTAISEAFRPYIWGEKGISKELKKLHWKDYGNDLELALFQFHVKPYITELQYIKEIESYRKNEKAIGIPIIVNDENFFNKTEEGRYEFLKQSILQKMDLLAEVVKKRKLDTNMDLLKSNLEKVLQEFMIK
ncbi:hypothetical protein LF887_16305 [Chryseobacterium sp. MEBOG06]|uniref:hypothetical protein n=1 Tax=Chryseobacterium sp. MEBOG06 TaxID=2879938 RepID=UPI001F4867FD|nr:hypothetical protein [Chryseobacterium sp. MEBOG06]UKB82567.1 hypothetical protein LF887_16305 [Chryseobacterium sp. MEBOG06]